MKKLKLFNWLSITILAFLIVGCEDEPLTGEFIQIGDPTQVEPGQFKAQIEGEEFLATLAGATLSSENLLTITGTNDVTGETITLVAQEGGIGVFNLIAGSGTDNGATYYPAGANNPYISTGSLGGSGQLNISELNSTELTISGTFSFIGKRAQLDANGDPVLDSNGNPIVDTISASLGIFNAIPYVLDDTGGGGGGGGGTGDPQDEFFALIEGVEFVEDTITTTITAISGVDMMKIVAKTSTNALIRIDFPLFSGEGTFDMVAISDGTDIIGLYNSNTGGENLTSSPGTITITNIDTEEGIVEATFQFTGSDPLGGDPTVVSVTGGSFTLYFEGIPGSGPSPFTADVDGVAYEPESVTIINSVFSGTPVVNIITNTVDNKNLSIIFPKDIAVGTYDMTPTPSTGNEKIGSYNPDLTGGGLPFWSNTGTLTITSYDTLTGDIEGTFSFTATDPFGVSQDIFEITNGTFSLTLP
ncbi:DUF6252 family protein [Ulvibacter antarcticus]|uniref:Uncharacterized protein n=1 Tax=Ulvibacter antarcticus TaxID=442714 RepID=A0A3L9YTU7_9FLAO|nr:DUF6252 family protein [Ulvibacter antarcticus]RMA64171.1 hypothetical protein BXY75_1039 [Ulvibacter antarcticus]